MKRRYNRASVRGVWLGAPQGSRNDRLTVGGAALARVEETVDTSFMAEGFFAAFDPEVLRSHMSWLAPRYYIAERGALLLPAHFPAPHGGRVREAGDGFKLEWLAA